MAEIQMIDHGQANWDKIFNANFKAIGNGSATFGDTGWIKDGITLLNGAEAYTGFAGDTPSFRIVQLGTLTVLMLTGSITNVSIPAAGTGLTISVATFPSVFAKWFMDHDMVNRYFTNSINNLRIRWYVDSKGTVQLTTAEDADPDGKNWLPIYHTFIS